MPQIEAIVGLACVLGLGMYLLWVTWLCRLKKKKPRTERLSKKKKHFPFHTVIEGGYCATVDIDENGDVIIKVSFGNREPAERFTKKLRGRHKYE